jgi:hypothetical protein
LAVAILAAFVQTDGAILAYGVVMTLFSAAVLELRRRSVGILRKFVTQIARTRFRE